MRKGEPIASAGQRVTAGLLASLINAEVLHVQVHRRPRIRVIVSGDEVRPIGTELTRGQVPDSNGPLVNAILSNWGLVSVETQHVGDDARVVREILSTALKDADLVITTGGASMGNRDFIVSMAEDIGVRRVFWKVAQKPGKPIFFGIHESHGRQSALMALPGNPGAVLVGMLVHARRLLDSLEGLSESKTEWFYGIVMSDVECDPGRTRLVRMKLSCGEDGLSRLTDLPRQDSHMLSNLSDAAVLVWIPACPRPLIAGTSLRWMRLPG